MTPSYINDVLKLGIRSNGIFSSICSAVMWIVIMICGISADFLINRYPDKITLTRKTFYSAGLIASSVLISLLGFFDCFHLSLALFFLIAGRAALGCPCSVVFCNQVDIAPKYAGLLVGSASTYSAVAGLLSPAIAGIITKHQTRQEWQIFFYICSGIGIFGAFVYLILGSGEVQTWAKNDYQEDRDLENLTPIPKLDESSKLTTDSKKIYT
ncbi:sialin-like [Tubulanus polymorphus]|uniref:sialin-like n=1 Tax=Tubulanus polymorphus TaxID=672921 RepID=UPI003DA28F84